MGKWKKDKRNETPPRRCRWLGRTLPRPADSPASFFCRRGPCGCLGWPLPSSEQVPLFRTAIAPPTRKLARILTFEKVSWTLGRQSYHQATIDGAYTAYFRPSFVSTFGTIGHDFSRTRAKTEWRMQVRSEKSCVIGGGSPRGLEAKPLEFRTKVMNGKV